MTGKNTSRSSRSTVGTATETSDYLRLLFAKIGHVFCLQVRARSALRQPAERGRNARRAAAGHALHDRLPLRVARAAAAIEQLAGRTARRRLRPGDRRRAAGQSGRRCWRSRAARATDSCGRSSTARRRIDAAAAPIARIPRSLALDSTSSSIGSWPAAPADSRLRDSLETAFTKGRGRCYAFVEEASWSAVAESTSAVAEHLKCPALSHSLSPLPSPLSPRLRSTAGRGGGSASARSWPARIAASSIRRPSRGCTASTVRWGPVPSAKVLAT